MTPEILILLFACTAIAAVTALLPKREWRISTAALAVVLAVSGTFYIQHMQAAREAEKRAEARRIAIITLAKEVSPAQYIALASLVGSDPDLDRDIASAADDGHVIWSEYGPIEEKAAYRLGYAARDRLLKAIGQMHFTSGSPVVGNPEPNEK